MDLLIWLASPYSNDPNYTIGDRLAELTTVNGGTTALSKIGKSTATTENRYGRLGLLPHEALELAQMNGAIGILSFMFPHQRQEFMRLLKEIAAGKPQSLIQEATEGDLEVFMKGFKKITGKISG